MSYGPNGGAGGRRERVGFRVLSVGILPGFWCVGRWGWNISLGDIGDHFVGYGLGDLRRDRIASGTRTKPDAADTLA